MNDIKKSIEMHKKFLIEECGYKENQILGVFLYGSQNYGTDLPTSDVDTKAIIVPTSREAILTQKLHVKEYHLPNEEHCEVMDIRHFVNNLRKQNINFVEVLFTDYCWVNPMYVKDWKSSFTSRREEIGRYDMPKAVASIVGQTVHTLSQGPCNGKKVSNGMRLLYFLKSYIEGDLYEDCIYPDKVHRELFKDLKLISELPSDKQGLELKATIDELGKSFTEKADLEYKAKVDTFMNDGIMALIYCRELMEMILMAEGEDE